MSEDTIDVFGKVDCADTLRTRALLDGMGTPYRFHDVVADPSAAERAAALSGAARVPVVRFPGGTVLVEPPDEAVRAILEPDGAA